MAIRASITLLISAYRIVPSQHVDRRPGPYFTELRPGGKLDLCIRKGLGKDIDAVALVRHLEDARHRSLVGIHAEDGLVTVVELDPSHDALAVRLLDLRHDGIGIQLPGPFDGLGQNVHGLIGGSRAVARFHGLSRPSSCSSPGRRPTGGASWTQWRCPARSYS